MAKETQNTELVKPSQAEIDAAYGAIFDNKPLPVASDPEVVSRAIMERILEAETFEEAFQPQSLPAWKDMMDVPVFVRGIHLNKSTIKGGTGPTVYAVVDIADAVNGDAHTVTCGGRNVLVQLVKMLEKGWLDKPVKLTSRPTAEGYEALWLEAA